MLNRALVDRITIDDEENTTATPKPAIATILTSNAVAATKKPCPAMTRGKARTFPMWWT